MIIKEYTGFLDEKAKEQKRLEKLTKNQKTAASNAAKKAKKKGDN